MLPLWLYLMLVALPVIWTISRSYIHRWYAHWRLQRTRKQAVHAVQQAIARAVAAHNGYALFEAWQQFLSKMLPARWLHEDASGTTYVQAAGASAAELAQWRACWQALTEQAFGTKDISSLDALAQQANSCALLVYKIVARKGSV